MISCSVGMFVCSALEGEAEEKEKIVSKKKAKSE